MFLWNILLAFIWCALRGEFSLGNLAFGFVVGYVVLWVTSPVVGSAGYLSRVPRVVSFALFFLKELLLANLRLAYDVVRPIHRMRPGVVAVPLEAHTDTEIAMLANLITLTPGTLTLDVSTDRRVLYIHGVQVADAESFRREIKKGLERRLLEVLR